MMIHEHAHTIICIVAERRIPVWLARARVESLPVDGSVLHVRGWIDNAAGIIRYPNNPIGRAAVKALRAKVLLRDAARAAITQTKERRGLVVNG